MKRRTWLVASFSTGIWLMRGKGLEGVEIAWIVAYPIAFTGFLVAVKPNATEDEKKAALKKAALKKAANR